MKEKNRPSKTFLEIGIAAKIKINLLAPLAANDGDHICRVLNARGAKHTKIRLRNGGVLRLSKGSHEIRFFEDRLRRDIRRLQEM